MLTKMVTQSDTIFCRVQTNCKFRKLGPRGSCVLSCQFDNVMRLLPYGLFPGSH